MVRSLLAGLFARAPRTTSTRKALASRLALEPLETREVPAVMQSYVWTDATTIASEKGEYLIAANWYDVTTGTVPLSAPGSGSTITFDSADSNDDCTDLSVASLNSLNIVDGYTGTVTVLGPLQVGTLNLTGAAASAISQPAEAYVNDITVTSAFIWTNGTLNSSTNVATLHIQGTAQTNLISPLNAGTVATGDNISVESQNGVGSTLEFDPGTVSFGLGTGLTINQYCFTDINAPANATVNFTANLLDVNSKGITNNAGGTLTVTGPGSWNGYGLPLTNSGTVEIKGNATVSFAELPNTGMYTFTQNAGTTKLHSGSTLNLKSSWGMYLKGGDLHIIADSPVGATAPAALTGNLNFSGGTITFEGNYWTFAVSGDVTWSGGSFNPRINTQVNNSMDNWNISGTLTLPKNSTAQVSPITVGWNAATGINAAWRWEAILFGSVTLVDNKMPTIVTPAGNAKMAFFVTQDANGNTHWYLGASPN